MNDHDEAMREVKGIITSGLMAQTPLKSRQHGGLAACHRIAAYIERNRTIEAERDALLAVVNLPDPEPSFYRLGRESFAHKTWRKRQEARAALPDNIKKEVEG